MNDLKSKEEEMLLFFVNSSLEIFNELIRNRNSYLKNKYKDCTNADDVLNIMLCDFSNYFLHNRFNPNCEIPYSVFYFIYQTFYFSDPENFFLYDEDFIQTLIGNTYISFVKFLKRSFSRESLYGKTNLVSINTFIVRNFSKVMIFELQNMKRKMEVEINKPCSQYNDIGDSYNEVFSNSEYEMVSFPKIDMKVLKKIYE